ncbi:MAG: phosphate signaling complex protein PhoU [Candidatus Promineifilaceae bacterium]|jgi:phosphate transport system protein
MAREHFDRELDNLKVSILMLGSEVGENIIRVSDTLLSHNPVLARRLIEGDERINTQRIDLVMSCLTIIATQQPMAKDMRFIATVIETAGELERINDYVKGIAKSSLDIGAEVDLLPSYREDFPRMAQITSDMLDRAMTAFSEGDALLAKSLAKWDNQVDYLFNKLYREIVAYASENSSNVALANQLEWTVHNMERSADRVVNICEWVVYMVTGNYSEFESEFNEYETPPTVEITTDPSSHD